MSGYFESVRWNACVHRLDLGLYSHLKEFWRNGVRTHVNSKGKIPSSGNILLGGGSNPRCCIKQNSKPNTLPMSYSSPLKLTFPHNFTPKRICVAIVNTLQTGHFQCGITTKSNSEPNANIPSKDKMVHSIVAGAHDVNNLVHGLHTHKTFCHRI